VSILNKIKKNGKEKFELISELNAIEKMIRGTYVETHRKCGKPTCRCFREEIGHPCYQVSWSKNGKSHSKSIPKDDISWIKEMTGNYKRWRSLRSDLRRLEDNERNLINLEEDKIIKKTEKLRKYFCKKPT